MADQNLGATLIVSIDLPILSEESANGTHYSDDHVVKTLAPMLARHQVSATWGFANPATSQGLSRLLAVSPAQEVALHGDASAELAVHRPLARRVSEAAAHAEQTGYRLSTLVLRRAQLGDDWRNVMRHGVTALSGATVSQVESSLPVAAPRRTLSMSSDAAPRAIRYGLWEFPAQSFLPWKTSLWTLATSSLRTRQSIDRAASNRELVHLVIDGAAYCAVEPRVQRWLERILEHVSRRRAQGRLEVLSVVEAVLRLAQTRRGEPARSILHESEPERPLAA